MAQGNSDWSAIATAFANIKPNRPEVELETVPAPARLATNTAALLADVAVHDEPLGNGRLVLLHEPTYQTEWDGGLRLVGFVTADLESELVTDSLLLEVGWSWVTDAFEERGLSPTALSGTVSRSGNQSFGDIANRPPTGAIEIRSSWTVPADEDFESHVAAWLELLCAACGLEPLPDDVRQLRTRQ